MRSEIFLGDLARALEGLKCRTDDEARRIANCLGFGVKPVEPPRPPVEIYDPRTVQPALLFEQRPRPPVAHIPPLAETPPQLPSGSLASQLKPLALVSVIEDEPAPDWLNNKDSLYLSKSETAVSRESLFTELTHRHIISASLATLRTSQEIDVPKLLTAVCRQTILVDLPRCKEATLDLGCQILLDYSATMVPFWEDLNSLIEQVNRVMGAASTRVYSFDTRPTEAMYWTMSGERKPWQPEQRPVLVATDFGLMGKTGRAQLEPAWKRFVDDCARDGSPLVILIPWPQERWPLNIGDYPSFVHWSPHTSAAMIKRKLGMGHGSRR